MRDIKRLEEYYKSELVSKLKRFEILRYRILAELIIGLLLLLLLISLTVFHASLAIYLMLLIPIWIYYYLAKNRIQYYKKKLKPLIIQSLIDFINPEIAYYPEQFISYEVLNQSAIFPVEPDFYFGEDYMNGRIGDVNFEICELKIYHPSKVNSKILKLFQGIFFHAVFSYNANGKMLIIPRKNWHRFSSSIKNLTKYGAVELEKTGNTLFDSSFRVFYDEKVKTEELLNDIFIKNMNSYYSGSQKEILASFHNNHFFLAISEKNDFFDRFLLRSNTQFKNILEYYIDLKVFIKFVEDFDKAH